jgi:hypothetical protein
MPSGEDIPYQLRPNKFIDRQIFIDLLSKIVPSIDHGKYAYISMGGKHLVDQEAVYRRVGIHNLFSFDLNGEVVARQRCNRPIAGAICEEMSASDLASELDGILDKFPKAEHVIAWLDYTDTRRLSQLQELCALLRKCRPRDVVRITMNAHNGTLNDKWQNAGAESPALHRANMLRESIGPFYDTNLSEVGKDDIPLALSFAVKLAASLVERERANSVEFVPVLLTSYADGQRMFTATILTVEKGEQLPIGLNGWDFMPKDWSKIVTISAPDLSLREKVEIDKHLDKPPSKIIRAIRFQPSSESDEARVAVGSYKKLHRYYPTFSTVGVQ